MTPFELLRQRVIEQPDAVAVVTPYRVASFRKMWSRIERSTARLQAEWGIRPGDTIAYLGCGHLDALVMYFAVARCGARMMPLEHAYLQNQAAALIRQHGGRLVLYDDAIRADLAIFDVQSRPLSTLIATVCRHRESVQEDSGAVSLLEFAEAPAVASADLLQAVAADPPQAPSGFPSDRALGASALSTPRLRSLDALAVNARACPAGCNQVRGALFDAGVFAPVILASLLSGVALTLLENGSGSPAREIVETNKKIQD